MATNYFLSKSFFVTVCLSVIVALAQPSIGNALTFKKGEKKSFNDPSENSQVTQSMTKAEKKEYEKDQSRAKQKNIFQHDWRKVAKDDSYGSFKSPFFHSELVSGQNFPSIGVAANAFDGVYKYDYNCNGDTMGQSPWDGSKFFIENGVISNDRGGAGRIKMKFGEVDSQGRFLMKFFRISPGGKKYTGRDFVFSGQLGTEAANKFKNRHLAGNFFGFGYQQPVAGGERDDGKFRYTLGCVGFLEKVGELSDIVKAKPFEGLSIVVKSRNPRDAWDLLNDQGEELYIKVKISGDDAQTKKGLIIVLPSSGPDMSDEEHYAQAFNEMGYASVVLYGAQPRYSSKFSTSYTSYMQARDAIAALDLLERKFGLGEVVAIAGSSQGSLAALRTTMLPYVKNFPNLAKVSHIIMINAACPDSVEVPISQNAKVITFNGRSDNALPPEICSNMKASSKADITNVVYEGGHHFESPFYKKGVSDGKHLLANCAIAVHDNLEESATIRKTGETRRLLKGQSHQEYSKWIIENCLGSGTVEGYEEASAKQMWSDLKVFLEQ